MRLLLDTYTVLLVNLKNKQHFNILASSLDGMFASLLAATMKTKQRGCPRLHYKDTLKISIKKRVVDTNSCKSLVHQ